MAKLYQALVFEFKTLNDIVNSDCVCTMQQMDRWLRIGEVLQKRYGYFETRH